MTIEFMTIDNKTKRIYYPEYEFGSIAYWSAMRNPKILMVTVLSREEL